MAFSKLRLGLILAAFLSMPVIALSETELPDNAIPMGTDPETGRDIFWIPVEDDADHVAALQGSIKSQELQLYYCERDLRDTLEDLRDQEDADIFKKGTEEDFDARPPRPDGWGESKPDRGDHNRPDRDGLEPFPGLERAGDFVLMNQNENTGPILVRKTIIPALKKRKEALQAEIWDCVYDRAYASWLSVSADVRGRFEDFASGE